MNRRASSDVGPLRSLGLALPFYGVAVLAAYAAPADVRALLLERGWVPHAIMLLTSLALAILVFKAVGLRGQRRAFALDVLPEHEPRITPVNVSAVMDHVEALHAGRASRGRQTFLLERVLRILVRYAARGDVAETAASNDADADADAASIAGSFSVVKVLVWAIPILGFIGTVIGIGNAVGGFSHALQGADQLDSIKGSLREVTTGLAVAFDTTLVALVASIVVMLPMSWLQKAEEKLVGDVDDYCVTHVLSRLVNAPPVAAKEAKPQGAGAARRALEQRILDTIAEPLAEVLSENARLMARMTDDRAALHGAQLALQDQLSALAAASREVGASVERAAGQMERATSQIGPGVERAVAELTRAAAQMAPGVERVLGQVERAAGQMERATATMGPGVERAVAQLERSTTLAEQAAGQAGRTQDQLSRELGASRQLLQLLAAGLGAPAEATPHLTRRANGTNGTAALGE